VTVGNGFIAAIEPWHGHQVVLYERDHKQRQVIDSSLVDGHTILAADLIGDAASEIIAGYRGPGTSVYVYQRVKNEWKRSLLDDHMAAASCAAADLNGDGRIDIVCIGSSTMNLKWYENIKPSTH
jgi:hypothetical protein